MIEKNLNNAMRLSAGCLLNSLNRDGRYLPYWLMKVSEDYRAHFHFYRSVHNIGRWWDALLRLEAVTDFRIPTHHEKAMMQNLKDFFDNEDHICIEPDCIPSSDNNPILFHFDYVSENIVLSSSRTSSEGMLTLDYCGEKQLKIRIPKWIDENRLNVIINGENQQPQLLNGFLQIVPQSAPQKIVITYPLPKRVITERIAETDYKIRFIGDEIIGISPNVSFYPLYSTLQEGADYENYL